MRAHVLLTSPAVATILFTGCSGSDDGKAIDKSLCEKAPTSVTSAISDGFTNSTFELHDAQMVKVPAGDQSSTGYPSYIVAGSVTGPDGADPSAVGVWSVSEPSDPGPIFALNPGAKTLTNWGTAIQDGSQMAETRDIIASLDSTQAAQDCL